jgi:hypothetical protein
MHVCDLIRPGVLCSMRSCVAKRFLSRWAGAAPRPALARPARRAFTAIDTSILGAPLPYEVKLRKDVFS